MERVDRGIFKISDEEELQLSLRETRHMLKAPLLEMGEDFEGVGC